jgi:hypothetical protein
MTMMMTVTTTTMMITTDRTVPTGRIDQTIDLSTDQGEAWDVPPEERCEAEVVAVAAVEAVARRIPILRCYSVRSCCATGLFLFCFPY